MSEDILWNCGGTVASFGIEVPAWIDADITGYTIAVIEGAGCASGAYMPAAYYHSAAATMAEHGDAVLDHLADCFGSDIPLPNISETSWAGLASHFLMMAVDVWAFNIADELRDAIAAEVEAE